MTLPLKVQVPQFGAVLRPQVLAHRDDGVGRSRPMLLWRFPPRSRSISTAVVGGGLLTDCRWVLNAEIDHNYSRDPYPHLMDIAAEHQLPTGLGAALMTAALVSRVTYGHDRGAEAAVTVGLTHPTWAADNRHPSSASDESSPSAGTINIVCWLPEPHTDAALVNAIVTITEAKTQALLEAGVPGTGTATDAIVIVAPQQQATSPHCYGGPRSTWGERLARATYTAVTSGVAASYGPNRQQMPGDK
jgi:adenosylcobinamide hydrolase